MSDYYTAEEIKKVIGCSQSLAYKIIRELRESFKNKFPEAIDVQGRIPKWYFEEIMMNKKKD